MEEGGRAGSGGTAGMSDADAALPFDEAAFDARAARLGLTLTERERTNALVVARFLQAAARVSRAVAAGRR